MSFVRLLIGASPAILVAMALASPSRAAEASINEPVPTTRTTDVDLGVDVAYDSNVARSDRDLAARRGLTLADEITTPSFDFTIARPVGRTVLFVKGDGDYDFHAINTRRDHLNLDFKGGAGGHFGPCQESLVGDYGRTQSDLADLAQGVTSNTRENEDVKFNAACGRAIGLAPGFGVTYSWVDNSNLALRPVDSRSLIIDASLAYRQPVLGSISIFDQYVSTSYPSRFTLPSGQVLGSGFDIYTTGLRYERHIGTRFDTTLAVSYTALYPSLGGAGFRGLTYSLDASYNLTTRLKIHGSAERQTVPSNRVVANYKLDETYDADVSYTLSSRLTLKASGQIMSSSYRGGLVAAAGLDLTNETLYTTMASATYDLTKRLSVMLSAGDVERRANFPGLSYSSTKVTLGVKAKF